MKSAVLALLIAAVVGAGCSSDSPAAPTATPASTTEFFVGTLGKSQTAFYSFAVTASGTTAVTLASVTISTPGPPPTLTASAASLSLGLGVPSGTGCQVDSVLTRSAVPSPSVPVAAALVSQISATLSVGVYCVQLVDFAGALPDPTLPATLPANFAVRITHT